MTITGIQKLEVSEEEKRRLEIEEITRQGVLDIFAKVNQLKHVSNGVKEKIEKCCAFVLTTLE